MGSGDGKLVTLGLCPKPCKGFALNPPKALPLETTGVPAPQTPFTMLRIVAAYFSGTP